MGYGLHSGHNSKLSPHLYQSPRKITTALEAMRATAIEPYS